MRRLMLLAGLAGVLAAQAPSEPFLSSEPRLELGVLAAVGLGDFSTDLNGHPGFGFRLGARLPVASRFELRPAFEWTGYRVSGYNLAARALASSLGASYEETRTVFRTYRLGMDGLFYFRPGRRGPFLSAGLGAQRSQVYLEDRAVDADGNEQIRTLDTDARKTGLWLGAGLGYQGDHANIELRLSEAPYAYAPHRAPTAAGTPFEARQGWALHVIVGARF